MDSIIFDLDGTLWNATRPAYEALIAIEKQRGTPITDWETFLGLIGKPMDEIAAATLLGLEDKEKEEAFLEFYDLELELIRQGGSYIYPHLVESLEKLKEDYRLFIVSNCQEGYIETFLEVYKLDYLFEDFLSWGASQQHKGKNILKIMKDNGVESAVYVGDTRGDEEAAELAGVPYYHFSPGFGQAKNPKAVFDDHRQLLEFFPEK